MKFQLLIFTILLSIVASAPSWPFSELQKKLSPEQLQEVRKIIRDSLDKPKSEFKANLKQFISTLPQDLQDLAKQEKERMEQLFQEAGQKVQSLSPEAQKIYQELKVIHRDDSISMRESMKKIKETFKNADQTALKELKAANLFGVKSEIIPENLMNF